MVTTIKPIQPYYKLLPAKIKIPYLQNNLVLRTHLINKLVRANKYNLTLLVAPAGYGKTTGLSQWASLASYPIAWLSLDQNDNDPNNFWGHFISSLQDINPNLRTKTTLSLSNESINNILKELISDLSFELREYIVVLDDYHVIKNTSIHDGLNFLIKYSEERLRFVLASRNEPPLDLTQIRVRDQLLELRMNDIRFATEEIKAYFGKNLKLQLSRQDLDALEKITEGWAAGLYLAGLALRSKEGLSEIKLAFENSHELILDYLSDQVLKNQPEEIYDFLIKTSILDQLNKDLCNAITGEKNSEKILRKLEKENLFILPVDGKRNWYRYHELFADLLREQLKKCSPTLTSDLHQKASRWYEDNMLMEDAIQHALEAKDFERATQLLHQVLDKFLARSEVHRVLQWRLLMPKSFIDYNPDLCLLFASAFLLTGQFDQTESMLLKIEQTITVEPEELGGLRLTQTNQHEPESPAQKNQPLYYG